MSQLQSLPSKPQPLDRGASKRNIRPKVCDTTISGQHVFFTGFTGTNSDGSLSSDPETQMRSAFEKIGFVLRDAQLSFGSPVEMTTYHVGLRDHIDVFKAVRAEYVKEPYPAWTAIEVAGFIREVMMRN